MSSKETPGSAKPRTDWVAAGIIYWELATGQSPDGRRLRKILCVAPTPFAMALELPCIQATSICLIIPSAALVGHACLLVVHADSFVCHRAT